MKLATSPFTALRGEIDRIFSDFSRNWPAVDGQFVPKTDMTESEREFRITAELPGLEEKDVEITLVDDVLTVRGEKKAEREENNDNRHLVERSYGSFSRSLRVPEGVKPEDIKATMSKGVLTVTVPKPAEAAKPATKINIEAAA